MSGPAEARLVSIRIAAGYRSWRELCVRAGIAHGTLWRFLGGELGDDGRSRRFISKLAVALNVTAPVLRMRVAAYAEERKAARAVREVQA